MASLLGTRYALAERVILVCDDSTELAEVNLNTHTAGAFYEAFPPEQARELLRRIEFRYTPKHRSWLNIAQNELSCMTRQCLGDRRFGTVEELRKETSAWAEAINTTQKGVAWQFTIEDARRRLKALYPKIKN